LIHFFKTAIDPKMGDKVYEKSFGDDCRIFTPEHPTSYYANLIDKLDVFFVAHVVGWAIKMFICRDLKMCML